MKILITGGAGYIGSHAAVALLEEGHHITVIDNLSNSSKESLKRVEKITNKKVLFYELDLCNYKSLEPIFKTKKFDAVIHFAGLKSVEESVSNAFKYYYNNLISTLNLLKAMRLMETRKLVFSSSAAVYGNPKALPIIESTQRQPTSPYGQTKLMIEQMLEDLSLTNEGWNITCLRYFNPTGAHFSGLIGEDPKDLPNNLIPYISQVAFGKLPYLNVFGDDYDTIDGTGLRDFVHVVDLANAHLTALKHLDHPNIFKVYNIGTGKGVSVLEAVQAFEAASNKKIPYKITPRRPGDVAACFADPSLAEKELGWRAKLSINDACQDTWKWQLKNPNGYI